MNYRAVWAIYTYEMARTKRTLFQSVASPVISTCLYFVVFGSAIGSRISEIDGVSYGAFIVPGLIMLSLMTQSLSNASFGIYFPRFTSARSSRSCPRRSPSWRSCIAYVGAAATKSVIARRDHSDRLPSFFVPHGNRSIRSGWWPFSC